MNLAGWTWPIIRVPGRIIRVDFLGAGRTPASTPRGYRWEHVEHRDEYLLVPTLLYWPRWVWRMRYRLIFRPLVRLRLWEVPEGHLFVNGCFTWPWTPRWHEGPVWR